MKLFTAPFIALALIVFAAMPASANVSCYGGATVGYSTANVESSLDSGGVNIINIDSLSAEGVNGGLLAGCDLRVDRFLVGGWGDYTWHGAEFELGLMGTPFGIKLDNQWSVGGRAGLFVTDNTLLYGLVGFTRAEVEFIGDLDGVVYGGGLEVDVGQGFVIGAEYRYTDLDDVTFALGGGDSLNFDPNIHTARAVLKYKFDVVK